jgi:hypothetical protein
MNRSLALAHGVVCYRAFLAAFLYAIGFVGNILVPRSIDSGPGGPLGAAVLVDSLLLVLFAVPHGVMARPGLRRWWTRFITPPIERSTYVLTSSLFRRSAGRGAFGESDRGSAGAFFGGPYNSCVRRGRMR